MKIVRLQAENIKRIKAIDIAPDGDQPTVKIKGKNKSGKSSVLNSIWYALGGKAGIPEKPIREGHDNGYIKLDFGPIKVTRIFSGDGKVTSALQVKTEQGFMAPRPQQLIKDLLEGHSVDPMTFYHMPAQEQYEILLRTVGLNDKLDELSSAYDDQYQRRRDIRREIKRIELELMGIHLPADIPETFINVAEITSQLEAAQGKTEAKRQKLIELNNAEKIIQDGFDQVDKMQEQLRLLQESLEAKRAEHARMRVDFRTMQRAYNSMQDGEDEKKELMEQLAKSEQVNDAIRLRGRYMTLEAHLKNLDSLIRGCDEEMGNINVQKNELLTTAQFPIEGLTVDTSNRAILYNGIPMEQLSGSERVMISASVTMANKPDIRVLCVEDGNILDQESMAALTKLAQENDYQLWIEIVSDNDKGEGFYIEDGSLSTVDIARRRPK